MMTSASFSEWNFLVIGGTALGAELIKNILLMGPKSITVFDQNIVTAQDLQCNIGLRQHDLGQNRSTAVCRNLQSINPDVHLAAHIQASKQLSFHILHHFDFVIVAAEIGFEELIRINGYCRVRKKQTKHGGLITSPIGMLSCAVNGVFGYIFHDFGPDFGTHNGHSSPNAHENVDHIHEYHSFRKAGQLLQSCPEDDRCSNFTAPPHVARQLHLGFAALDTFAARYDRPPSGSENDEVAVLALAHELNDVARELGEALEELAQSEAQAQQVQALSQHIPMGKPSSILQ